MRGQLVAQRVLQFFQGRLPVKKQLALDNDGGGLSLMALFARL